MNKYLRWLDILSIEELAAFSFRPESSKMIVQAQQNGINKDFQVMVVPGELTRIDSGLCWVITST